MSPLQSPSEKGKIIKTNSKEDFPNPIVLKQILCEDTKHISEDFIDISEKKIPLATKIEWDQQKDNSIKKNLKNLRISLCKLPSQDQNSILIKNKIANCSNMTIQLQNLEIEFESKIKKIFIKFLI